MTTLYCNASDCKNHNGIGCSLDYITIDEAFECSGYDLDV